MPARWQRRTTSRVHLLHQLEAWLAANEGLFLCVPERHAVLRKEVYERAQVQGLASGGSPATQAKAAVDKFFRTKFGVKPSQCGSGSEGYRGVIMT